MSSGHDLSLIDRPSPSATVGLQPLTFFLYGPPGSGKTTLGQALAERLNLPFYDLDEQIQAHSGMSIPEIFSTEGEAGFRKREQAVLKALLTRGQGIFALGGGTLLDPDNRAQVESYGPVLCLHAPLNNLLQRLGSSANTRPLLEGNLRQRLERLLAERAAHYASFRLRLETAQPTETLSHQAMLCLGIYRVQGMREAYDVRVAPGILNAIGQILALRRLSGPMVVISDEKVAPYYLSRVVAALKAAGYQVTSKVIPSGEQYKNLQTVNTLWEAFLAARLERGSTVLALGGGMVSDVVGFAAATYLRGINWVALPTTLLAMVDASLGGKTGVDLPEGKNLVGAFHPPRLVLADPTTLESLPQVELRAGMAEVVKAGLIGDEHLFDLCAQGWQALYQHWDEVISRAMAVKIAVIEQDPYEKGQRAVLNLGHTVGHAVELASGFQLRHGEAVAIGLAIEARLAHHLGIAQEGLAEKIEQVLQGLGLPTKIPESLDRRALCRAMGVDKKRASGQLRFALPVRVGEVQAGVEVADPNLVLSGIL